MNSSSTSAFGDNVTQYFFNLSLERVLDAVEESGLRCTGRALPLNSMENRVYEIEIELEESTAKSKFDHFRVAKFYRPGRWSKEQILEEHQFLFDLWDHEIPVVAPLRFADGSSLRKVKDVDIWYALFPKVGGRMLDEPSEAQLRQLGRLLGRLHNVGATKKAEHRIAISPTSYGLDNLKLLMETSRVPSALESRYQKAVEDICQVSQSWFEQAPYHRIHGDFHPGNILWNGEQPMVVDFDDMLSGPAVQDIWLLVTGRDEYFKKRRQQMIEAYEIMREFDWPSLRLIEPLRALRLVHFSAWITRRWQDQSFQRAFPHFESEKYWVDQIEDLQEVWELMQVPTTYG